MTNNNNKPAISFDQLLSKLAIRLISSEREETQFCIDEVIAAFGNYSGSDRCYVFEFNDTITRMDNTYEWVNKGSSPQIDELQHITVDDLPFFFQQMRDQHAFIIDDVTTLPPEANAEYQEFMREGIQSVICLGLVANHKLIGFVGCDMVQHQYHWSKADIQRLSSVADMIANTIERQRTYQQLIDTQRQLEEANILLQAQATQDGLTGIGNRRALDTKLQDEVKRAKRQGTGLATLLIDIDNFKAYNDFYGHLQGDWVLKSVAETVHSIMQRSTDFVARFGGEEFAIVISTDSAWQALRSANEVLDAIEELNIEHCKSPTEPYITVSIGGYFEFPGPDSDIQPTIERLLHRADEGLYQAKSDGRNCIRFR